MTADVVVVGAGPTGLMLAGELSLCGVRPIVLERRAEPSELPKANGVVGLVVRMLETRGLLDRLRAESRHVGPIPAFPFGSGSLDLSGLDPSPLDAALIPQPRLEHVLTERAAELDVEIRRGHEVRAMVQDADGVTVDVASPDGDYRLRTRFLVGCDGARSRVREYAGIEFPGTTATEVTRIGHVAMPDSVTALPDGDLEVAGVGRVSPGHARTERGSYALASFTPGVLLVSATEEEPSTVDTDAPMTLDELQSSLGRVLGTDLALGEPIWLSRVVGQSRLAERYRAGRVFLAGDAAHLFAAGGSALNVGLLDTVNLGWKLAAEVRGWAPPGLLDTYHAERHAAGARTLLQTRAQAALSASGEDAEALRELFGELLGYEQPRRHLAELLSGADVRYDMPGNGADPHPLVGRFAPDVRLPAGRPVLLHTNRPDLLATADGWADRIDVVAERENPPAAATLVRPDGYVAWAATGADTETSGLVTALSTWFGDPR